MLRILYDSKMPAEILPTVQRHVERFTWVLPPWLQFVSVRWCGEAQENPDHNIADCGVSYQYRSARINIYPSWLEETEYDRADTVLHELLHIPLAVLADYARERIKEVVPDVEAPKFHKMLVDEVTQRCESVVTDLAGVILAHESNG